MRIRKKTLYSLELIYIGLPILLFLFGWTKWYIALLCASILITMYVRFVRSSEESAEDECKISKPLLIVGVILIAAVGVFLGWGRWMTQHPDWSKHNTFLRDLTVREWPVYYRSGTEHSLLSYYIAQYLVPALVGKIFNSFRVTEIALYIWNTIGMSLVWSHVISALKLHRKSMKISSLVILYFFNLPTSLAGFILTKIYPEVHSIIGFYVFEGSFAMRYSSNLDMLRTTFNQFIVPAMIVLLLWENRKRIQYYVPLILPSLLYSAFAAIGLIAVAMIEALCAFVHAHDCKTLKSIFSLENILTLASLGGVLFFYYSGNVFSEKPDTVGIHLMNYSGKWIYYIIFVLFAVLPYSACMFKHFFKDRLFWITTIGLMAIPFVKGGVFNDLMARMSAPLLFLMMLYVISFLNEYVVDMFDRKNDFHAIVEKMFRKDRVKLVSSFVLLFFVFFGFICSFFVEVFKSDIHLNISNDEILIWEHTEDYANRDSEIALPDEKYNYYSYDVDETVFYKYIAREQDS